MTKEIPKYALRAYGMLYTKYGTEEGFKQDSLNWAVSSSMKKKIFSVLLNSGWIVKKSVRAYTCVEPGKIFSSLFLFKIPDILKKSRHEYCYSRMSAAEILTDFSYIQRSWDHSPYFIKIKEKDLAYWKEFLSKEGIPFFINEGSFIGEFVILETEKILNYHIYHGFPVEDLDTVVKFCKNNPLFEYHLAYIKEKFKLNIKIKKELIEKARGAM